MVAEMGRVGEKKQAQRVAASREGTKVQWKRDRIAQQRVMASRRITATMTMVTEMGRVGEKK